jgi:PAS domain S-box-containing protein
MIESLPTSPSAEQTPQAKSADLANLQAMLPSAAQVAIIATDLNGAITCWNPFAEQLYGWQSAEVFGSNIMQITVSSATEEEAAKHMATVLAGGTWAGEFNVRHKSGHYVAAYVTLSLIFSEKKSPIGIVGVSQDLSALKEAEGALRRSEEQFHAFANSLPELCWTAHPDGRIFWYNERWFEYTGTTPQQMEGWGWQSVHDPAILPSVLDRWRSSVDTGTPFQMEFPLRGADGVFRWFLTRVRPLRDGDGKIVRWYGTNTNIDEQRLMLQSLSEARDHLEKRVQERTAELNAANQSLRDLSARLLRMRDDEQRRLARELHDSVGQLVAAISMNVAVVSSEAEKLSPAAANCVKENAVLLQEVSREIRTLSHLLHPPLLDEAGLASALRWYVEGFAERSKLEVDLEIPPNLGRLTNDMEIAIFRVVQECLTNIHRHSGSSTASVVITRHGNRLLAQISDTGKGIPPEKLKLLTTEGRAGVGFAGMRERLRELGGSLKIQSDSKGTVVSAILPIAPAEEVRQKLSRS